ncbi:MAG: hypothetical protein JNK84_17930 [Phreatobacter sp.]|uniref:hypothetical protein n=1 Tax=Phreatobacter sp. TaxID=1966341 RepID=UPI001A5F1C9B|nr:hypothetical protein [Phreatobacter sp.]MBL8570953.1 hypothetical protein [Phreatobacter sp.]
MTGDELIAQWIEGAKMVARVSAEQFAAAAPRPWPANMEEQAAKIALRIVREQLGPLETVVRSDVIDRVAAVAAETICSRLRELRPHDFVAGRA